MGILETIMDANLATGIAITATIILLAGYIFFVIPILKENENLKEYTRKVEEGLQLALTSNVEKIEKLGAVIAMLTEHGSESKQALEQISKLQSINSKIFKAVRQDHRILTESVDSKIYTKVDMDKKIGGMLVTINKHIDDVLKDAILELKGSNLSKDDAARNMESIKFELENLKLMCESIKDKQTSLQGMLFSVGAGSEHQSLK